VTAVLARAHLYLPMTILDVRLGANRFFQQEVPASYNGFLYPLEGEVRVQGTTARQLSVGEIGWLEFGGRGTTVHIAAGARGARLML
jgi:quercetin 2,3-dioxygenase